MSSLFARAAGFAAGRPLPVLVLVAALTLAGALAALRLQTDAGTETLIDEGSPEFRATERFQQRFGADAVVVLVRGDVRKLVLTRNLRTLLELEACLASGTPFAESTPTQGGGPLPAVCDRIGEASPSRVVFGPATFLFQSVAQVQQVLGGQIEGALAAARAAGAAARRAAAKRGADEATRQRAARLASRAYLRRFQSQLLRLAFRYEITRVPRIDDPDFVSRIVFDPSQPAGTPKARFAYLFPARDAALISIRLRPDLTESERGEAIDLVREAVADPRFALDDADYVVSGVPAVVQGLADSLRGELLILLGAAVVAMALVLALVLDPPLRLLPLGVALAAAAITFGLLSLLGGTLTMASIAVLPVLIGLAVDYAIQFHARFAEARADGVDHEQAARAAAGRGGPVIATACAATAAGFAVLVLSPVPMVRSFGLLLIAGVVLALLIAATAGMAALTIAARRRPLRRPAGRIDAAVGIRARVGSRLRSAGTSALAVSIATPERVLAAGAVLAVCGWIAGTGTQVVSDIRELAPSSLSALRDIETLEDEAGVSGELDVAVTADDITDPEVVRWMRDFQQRVLRQSGFTAGIESCRQARLCPAVSLPELFPSGGKLTADRVRSLIAAIPPYFSQAVISRNPFTGGIGDTANIAFGIPVQPLDEQKELIDDVRAQIDPPGDAPGPPEGTTVELAGLPVLAAEANDDLSTSRYWLPPAALLAVGLALAGIYRSARRALVPLVPILLATGWSALVVASLDVSLNPMSATLGVLVIAIATEFSVLLSARYEAERGAGLSVGEALRRAYTLTGAAVLASGVTAITGFAALVATDVRMLRDFGLITVVDLGVALAGVMLVLPAVLVLASERLGGAHAPGAGREPAPVAEAVGHD